VTRLGRPPALPEIIEQHFDELDFLWEHREANVFSAEWALRHLAEHEERAEAHLDGLRIAGPAGVELARERLTTSGVFGATAATFVMWESGESGSRQACLTAFEGDDPAVREGIRVAFRHLRADELREPLLRARQGAPEVAAAAADVLAFHRVSMPSFSALLKHADIAVRRLALGASGRARSLNAEDVREAVGHEEATIRYAAWRSAASAGTAGLPSLCRGAAASGDPVAVAFLGVVGDASDVPSLMAAARQPAVSQAAVAALGALGLVTAVPFLLELMADGALGVAATAAYKRITGASAVEGEKPFPPPPESADQEEADALPPDPEKAKADWQRREGAMSPEVPWQAGIAVPPGALPSRFDELSLEARRDVYLRARAAAGNAIRDLELEALAARQSAA
jgi:uncharacterized protein (TIGR02270 family)